MQDAARWEEEQAEILRRDQRAEKIERCLPHDGSARLEAACRRMLEVTGGSEHWNGATHDALKMIEDALLSLDRDK